jgi:HNH endonuclease
MLIPILYLKGKHGVGVEHRENDPNHRAITYGDGKMSTGLARALAGFVDADRKLTVWAKGHIIPGYHPAVWRRDDFGRAMCYSDHGDRDSEYGWEIDHIRPTRLGGVDDIANLRPLHCANNSGLGGLLDAMHRKR